MMNLKAVLLHGPELLIVTNNGSKKRTIIGGKMIKMKQMRPGREYHKWEPLRYCSFPLKSGTRFPEKTWLLINCDDDKTFAVRIEHCE